ncbi:hypothetical protein DIPPA_29195 [Diplonema papillatum]|nr:hypothetical protein DIPPA_29195 [Diplonema papillatum]
MIRTSECASRAVALLSLILLLEPASALYPLYNGEFNPSSMCYGRHETDMALHRHIFDCPTDRWMLTGFGWSFFWCVPDDIRSTAMCTQVQDLESFSPLGYDACYESFTPCQNSQMGMESLALHDVQCGPQEALQRVEFVPCSAGLLQLKYVCCTMRGDYSQVTEHETQCIQSSTTDNNIADPQRVYSPLADAIDEKFNCPEGSYLQSFRYATYPACPLINGEVFRSTHTFGTKIVYTCMGKPPTRHPALATRGCRLVTSGNIFTMADFWNVDCPYPFQTLSGFSFGQFDCHTQYRRFKTECTSLPYARPVRCALRTTVCQAGYQWGPIFLDRHAAFCPDGQSMRFWRLVTCNPTDVNFEIEYECCDHDSDAMTTFTVHHTPCAIEVNTHTMFQTFNVNCPEGSLLKGWQMMRNQAECPNSYSRVTYHCLREAPFDIAPYLKPASPHCIDPHAKMGGFYGDTQINCGPDHVLNGFYFDKGSVARQYLPSSPDCHPQEYQIRTLCTRGERDPESCYEWSTWCIETGRIDDDVESMVGTHRVICAGENEALQQWYMVQCPDPDNGVLWYRFHHWCCTVNEVVMPTVSYSTACTWDYFDGIGDFADHPFICPGKSYLRGWELQKCRTVQGSAGLRALYHCLTPDTPL